ncbi:MAG: glycerophosphodiester phosphodiesterase family protein [Deltaproteobacteria bacterium]|nr:glycerophosphodiester phosphodiesterase family protein [Deltaproteobacteria bacterium]
MGLGIECSFNPEEELRPLRSRYQEGNVDVHRYCTNPPNLPDPRHQAVFVGAACCALVLFSCEKDPDAPIPTTAQYTIPSGTTALSSASEEVLEGIYTVTDGSLDLGDQVVLKFNKEGLTIDSGNGNYFCLKAGERDSEIFFQGYWRYAFAYEGGLASARIKKEEGGSDILAGKAPGRIIIRGAYGQEAGTQDQLMTLSFSRRFSDAVKNSRFMILANFGGGRNSDGFPVSQNSIEMLQFAQRFGHMGVEVDIRVSKDGVPFLYHDATIDDKACRDGPLDGPIDDYTWEEISSSVRLIRGEKIPSLEDALSFIVDSTDMEFVWLDMKVGDNAAARVIPIQMKTLARAKELGRNLRIVFGVPTQQVMDDFTSYPGYADIPSLCEMTVDDVLELNAAAWGPQSTRGLQVDGLKKIHDKGKIGITWSLDDSRTIEKFLNETNFDGFLTDYPCLVAYHHYIR